MNTFFINIVFVGLLSISSNGSLFSENFIGREKAEIEKLVSENHKMFKLNSGVINKSYNYLKYEDKIREITVLFFLAEDNTCRMIRIISDYSNINDLKDELNANYTNLDRSNWRYKSNDRCYKVELKEEDWYFTISIKED